MTFYKRTLDSLTTKEYDACLRLMEQSRKTEVQSIHNPVVRGRTVLGEWMAKTALSEHTGLAVEQIKLERDEYGKPAVKGLPLHFNVSHSGKWVVCAVSEKPVGVDIEQIRPLEMRLAERVCTESDAVYLKEAETEQERLERLYRLWTAKEAYFKWKGTGITNLKSVSFADILPHCRQMKEDGYIISIVEEIKELCFTAPLLFAQITRMNVSILMHKYILPGCRKAPDRFLHLPLLPAHTCLRHF